MPSQITLTTNIALWIGAITGLVFVVSILIAYSMGENNGVREFCGRYFCSADVLVDRRESKVFLRFRGYNVIRREPEDYFPGVKADDPGVVLSPHFYEMNAQKLFNFIRERRKQYGV